MVPASWGWTPRENLRYTARLNGLAAAETEEHINVVLDQVGLGDRADGRTDTYSRGMLQRLGIADALLKDPDVLILDEPTASIDPIGVVEILALLRQLVRERGMTVLLSSHLLDQVQSVCDRVGIFSSGRLIGVGTVAELAVRFGDGAAQLEATFLGEPSGAAEAIRNVAGVESAALDATSGTWRIVVRPATESVRVREEIAAVAAQRGLRLTSLRELEPSLEDIYRTAVASMAADPTHVGAVA
ncbi:MAG: transporter ATP-binding protein [Chloroflexi bacterium]|nr:transporter ATP-binding protein [Chloroflexota bacterium]